MFIFLANCSTASVDTHFKSLQCLNLKKNDFVWACIICKYVHLCIPVSYISVVFVSRSLTLESVFCWCSLLALSFTFPPSQFFMLQDAITPGRTSQCSPLPMSPISVLNSQRWSYRHRPPCQTVYIKPGDLNLGSSACT